MVCLQVGQKLCDPHLSALRLFHDYNEVNVCICIAPIYLVTLRCAGGMQTYSSLSLS